MNYYQLITRLIRSLVVIAACIFVVTSTSFAQPLSIINVDRLVAALGEDICPGCGSMGEDTFFSDGQSIQNTSVGLFDDSARSVGSDAWQTSTVSSAGIVGSGGMTGGFSTSNNAISSLFVDFAVPTTGTYNLSGSVRAGVSIFSPLSDEAYVALSDASGELFRIDSFDFVEETFDESLLLQSGVTYTLDARVSSFFGAGDDGDGSWTVSLSVPEPTGVTLVFSVVILVLPGRYKYL